MTDNLPDVPQFSTGDAARMPMSHAPTAALAFALGYAAARPVSANQFGPFCAMVEELARRPGGNGTPASPSEWTFLLATLPPDIARALTLLYQAQRGQRWAQTGRREG